MRVVKALLVDLDDTLLDYSGGVDECWHHACEALAGPAGIEPVTLVAAIVETPAGSGAIRAGTAPSARTCCAPGPGSPRTPSTP